MTHKQMSPRRDYPARMRPFADLLCLWRLCAKPACSRARSCRGDARVCFPRLGVLLPEGVQDWYDGVREAQAQGKPFNDAMAELDMTDAGHALREWYAT